MFLLSGFFEKPAQNSITFQKSVQKYPNLSQKIFTEYNRDLLINFVPLRTKLHNLIDKEYGNNFTMYFEYIPTGTSIGVMPETEFYSASLLKVPVVIAYYHHKEKNNIQDDQEVTIKESEIDNHFGSLWQRGAGSKIRLSEAVKFALTESDNTAAKILQDQLDNDDYAYVFNGLDILVKEAQNHQVSMTAKAYGSILKSLFFASLLSKENSEYILSLLSNTKFSDKLVAGVPDNIQVAHKIGVYENVNVPIYADCGIVYLPSRPYLLCMASRSDEKMAQDRMKTVSKMVYDYVATANKPDKP